MKAIIATAITVAFTATASLADTDWGGFYAGLGGAYTDVDAGIEASPLYGDHQVFFGDASFGSSDVVGVVGWRTDRGSWVYGLEAFGAPGTLSQTAVPTSGATMVTVENPFSLRLTAGREFGNDWLVSAGLGYAHAHTTIVGQYDHGNHNALWYGKFKQMDGVSISLNAERKLSKHLSVRAGIEYVDYGTISTDLYNHGYQTDRTVSHGLSSTSANVMAILRF